MIFTFNRDILTMTYNFFFQMEKTQNKSKRTHNLTLGYQEYLKRGKSISNSRIDKYLVYDQLGRGSFGAVYKGMDDTTKKTVAIKILDLYAIERQTNERVKEIKKRLAKTQPELMLQCNSDNVVKCFDVYSNAFLKIIVMEYCNGGELQKEIDKGRIPEEQAILILKQIINGISEMHTHNIIHRDLKAENILSHNGVYKIADLGFSKQVVSDDDIVQTTLGTITTMAPEVMKKQPYGLKADIWSIGVIFFQMIFGKVPYVSTNAVQMYDEIKSKKMLNTECFQFNGYKASSKVTSFLKEVMNIDKFKRLGWKQLIKHPIFANQGMKQHLSNEFRLNYELKQPEIKIDDVVENEQRERQNDVEERPPQQEIGHTVVGISLDQRKQKMKEMRTQEDALFLWVKKTHLQCLKTQLIYNKIFLVLERNKLLDMKDRINIQFMYLVITRCLNNISVINDKIKHEKQVSPVLEKLRDNVKQIYLKITRDWEKYSKLLTQSQGWVSSMVSDRFAKIFKSKSLEEKDKFLVGNQKLYYTKEEQIKFTQDQYIPIVRKEISQSKKYNTQELKNYLSHYSEINNVTEDIMKTRSFQEYVQMILQ